MNGERSSVHGLDVDSWFGCIGGAKVLTCVLIARPPYIFAVHAPVRGCRAILAV